MSAMLPRNTAKPALIPAQPSASLSDVDLQVIRMQTGFGAPELDRLTSAGGGYTLGRADCTFVLPPEIAALQMPVGMSLGDWLKRLIEDSRSRERGHRHHHHHHEPFPVPGGGSVTGGGWR